jgi:hypothetical protein
MPDLAPAVQGTLYEALRGRRRKRSGHEIDFVQTCDDYLSLTPVAGSSRWMSTSLGDCSPLLRAMGHQARAVTLH